MAPSPRLNGGRMTGLKTRIETPFFEESLFFYTDLLGMNVLESWGEGVDQAAILGLGSSVEGEAFLELAHSASPRAYDGLSLQFRVRDLDAHVKRLQGRWEMEGPRKRPWGSTYLYLKDPTGIQIILYEGVV